MIHILMATYNGEKYIKEQIDSILFQNYPNIRLFINDACSTDETEKIVWGM
jgi:rhamnosyltransferase